MKGVTEFIRTTLVGGLLVVVPVYLTALLLMKTVVGLLAIVAPVTSAIPDTVYLRNAAAIAILVLLCFVAGLVVRTRPGQRAMLALDRNVLEKVPGYNLLRSLTGRVEALVPAFLVEELDDGSCTVFVPAVPTPAAGSLYIMPRERVHLVDVPFTTAVSVITHWGTGAGQLIKGLHRASGQASTTPRSLT
jgi:uncharacterized membrane protein